MVTSGAVLSGAIGPAGHLTEECRISAEETFRLELMMSPTERGLLRSLQENHKDDATRNAYIDFLLEQGRPIGASLMRQKGFVPGATVCQRWEPIKVNAPGQLNSGGPIGAGHIGSGQIGYFHIASGNIGTYNFSPMLLSGLATVPAISSGMVVSGGIPSGSLSKVPDKVSFGQELAKDFARR